MPWYRRTLSTMSVYFFSRKSRVLKSAAKRSSLAAAIDKLTINTIVIIRKES